MLGFFIGFLTVVLVIVSLLMVFIVLMQRPKQEGLGAAFGGGVTDQMWGAQTTNVLQRGTVYLAVMFFVITLLLAVLVGAQQRGKIDTDKLSESTGGTASPSATSPDAPPLIPTNPDGTIDLSSIPGLLPPDATPAPPEGGTPAPAEGDAPAPAEGETPAPAEGETPVPAEGETPAPPEGEAPAPAEGETPAPAEGETPAPAEGEAPAPAEGETPAPAEGAAVGAAAGIVLEDLENLTPAEAAEEIAKKLVEEGDPAALESSPAVPAPIAPENP